jgi:hypothetical protein
MLGSSITLVGKKANWPPHRSVRGVFASVMLELPRERLQALRNSVLLDRHGFGIVAPTVSNAAHVGGKFSETIGEGS